MSDKKSKIVYIVYSVIVSIVIGSLAYIWCVSTNVHTQKEVFINVSDEKGLFDVLNSNSISREEKFRAELTSDIYLSQEYYDKIKGINNVSGSKGAFFYGTIEGNGYAIYIDAEMDAPIINTICNTASISGLTIANAVFQNKSAENIGVSILAESNCGLIENIAIKNSKLYIDSELFASALVGYNFGRIGRCVVETEYIIEQKYISTKKIDDVWKCRVGSIAAYNLKDGVIRGVFVSAVFPDNFVVLTLNQYQDKGMKNLSVGYAVGGWNYEKLNNIDDVYLVDGKYASAAIDFTSIQPGSMEIVGRSAITEANYKDWTVRWAFNNEDLPTLTKQK
ncbi:MAG: hypothetical protein IJ706_07455 [Clostridia bacterium]|nr:hypothetical protein [Clostridia bacterium]